MVSAVPFSKSVTGMSSTSVSASPTTDGWGMIICSGMFASPPRTQISPVKHSLTLSRAVEFVLRTYATQLAAKIGKSREKLYTTVLLVDDATAEVARIVGAALDSNTVGLVVGAWLVTTDVGAGLGGELSLKGVGVAVSSILFPLRAIVSSIKQTLMIGNTNRRDIMVLCTKAECYLLVRAENAGQERMLSIGKLIFFFVFRWLSLCGRGVSRNDPS